MSDHLVRLPGTSWDEIEALPQPLRWTVQRTIFHLLDEPVPTLADPFPSDDSLPGSDLMIAATAITEGLPLYTTNPADFTGLDSLARIIPVTRPPVPHERPFS